MSDHIEYLKVSFKANNQPISIEFLYGTSGTEITIESLNPISEGSLLYITQVTLDKITELVSSKHTADVNKHIDVEVRRPTHLKVILDCECGTEITIESLNPISEGSLLYITQVTLDKITELVSSKHTADVNKHIDVEVRRPTHLKVILDCEYRIYYELSFQPSEKMFRLKSTNIDTPKNPVTATLISIATLSAASSILDNNYLGSLN